MSESKVQDIVSEFSLYYGPLRYKKDLQGQVVIGSTIYIGDRLGPQKQDPTAICHELCHFVEIDDARMMAYGWGLSYPQVYVLGKFFNEPSTCQGVERELRVMAYQYHLQKAFGITEPIENDVMAVVKWSTDAIFIPINPDIEYKERDLFRHRWCMDRIEENLSVYTLDRFYKEFNRKINKLTRMHRQS